jgi:hypothetical protein
MNTQMMDSLSFLKGDSGYQVDGFPQAVKVIRLQGPRARRLAHLALHFQDLTFAERCLAALKAGPSTDRMGEALWAAAVIHFFKCFGQPKRRFQLDPSVIYAGSELAKENFAYFKAMRDRSIAASRPRPNSESMGPRGHG